MHTKVALAVGLTAVLSSALAVDMPANYTHLGWIESDATGKQWIDTGYAPKASTVITGKFQAKARVGSWVSLLGAFDRNDNSKNGVLLRYNNGNNALEGIFCTDYGKKTVPVTVDSDYAFVLKSKYFKIGDTEFTYADGNCYEQNFTTGAYTGVAFSAPIYVFAECNRRNDGGYDLRRQQPVRFYELKFEDENGTQRDFKPSRNDAGQCGFWDAANGVFYPNKATGKDFAAGGLTYRFDPATGAMTAMEGPLTAESLTGVTSIEKTTAGTLEAGLAVAVEALTVTEGALSLQDGTATQMTVSGALTLTGGTELKFDVTGDGVDKIEAGSLVFTGTDKITIAVRGVGVTSVAEETPILSVGTLTEADLGKFTLAAELATGLAIANGNLVLTPKAADPATWIGTSGDWSATDNWQDAKVPGPGAPVTVANTTGGTMNQDIAGLTVGSLTVAADAGSFTTSGKALTIASKLDNKSTAEQTLALPLTLGMIGKDFTLATAGDLKVTEPVTLVGTGLSVAAAEGATVELGKISGSATLTKAGDGTVKLMQDCPDFTGDLVITGGRVENTREIPFATDGYDNEIRISNGGTLDLGSPSLGGDKISFKSRKLVLAGEGVDGKGAVTYGGTGKHQYYAFRRAVLAEDATVGADADTRWDVRSQGNVGTFDFNGHTLTKVGGGLFALSGLAITNGDQPAGLNISGGTVLVENGSNLSGDGNQIDIASDARLQIYNLTNPIEWTLHFAGGSRFDSQNSSLTSNRLVGPTTFGAGTTEFTIMAGMRASLEGAASGEGCVKIMTGNNNEPAGLMEFLGGAKTYSGTTEVSGARLTVADKTQLPGYADGKVSVTGERTGGIVFKAPGWTVDDFTSAFTQIPVSYWRAYLGYMNGGTEPLEVTTKLEKATGGLYLAGETADLVMKGGISFPEGGLFAGDHTVIADEPATFRRVEMTGQTATMTVRNTTLAVNNSQSNVGDVRVGGEWPSYHRLNLDHATVKADPLPQKDKGSSALFFGANNNGVGILDLGEGSLVEHKICGGSTEWSRGAAYVRPGAELVNYGGTGKNDGYIAGSGYGFMENAGSVTFKGYSQVCNGSSIPRTVGILYNTGSFTFTGEYDGELDVTRGGTGLIYQTAGTIEALKNGFQINSNHGAQRGLGIWTVEGASTLAKGPTFYPANINNSEAIITLREGGTMEYASISPRANNYTSLDQQKFYLNMDGGFLRPQQTGTIFRDGERYHPNAFVAFVGGAGFDIGEGLTATLNVPVQKPQGRGIASITLSNEILNEEFIGAPFVRITGDGYGATAVALFDKETQRVTGVKVTSPGCNYTTATVEIDGGRRANNTVFTSATATLTDENQVCGGLIKKGSGTLKVTPKMLPEGKAPLAVLGGTLDLGGATYEASVLTLGEGAVIQNGKVVADKLVATGTTMLMANITLAADAPVVVEKGTLTVDLLDAGLEMVLVQCADAAGVRAIMKDEATIDWTTAVRVMSFNRANSQQNWGANQVLAYRGTIWNRGKSDVTWTFCEHFDDGTRVIVDGTTALEFDEAWNQHKQGRVTLTPGPHSFEVRFAQLGGGAGPATSSYHEDWPANTLAFGLAYENTESFDVTRYDHLTDLSDGQVFTVNVAASFAPGSLTVQPGAEIAYQGPQPTITYGSDITLAADDLIAGRHLTFGNAKVTFAAETTVTITDFDTLCQDETVQEYILVEADGGFAGLENLTFANPAPKGWEYMVLKDKRLALARKRGFVIFIR